MFVWLQALDLSPDLLAQREVVHVDIAFDGLSSGEKKPELVRRHFYGHLNTHIHSRVHGGGGRASNCQFSQFITIIIAPNFRGSKIS